VDDTGAIHSLPWRVLPFILLGISVVLTGFLIYDAVEAVRMLKTGYLPGFLFTTYLQSLTRLPRKWEMAAVAALPALSLCCSGLVALLGVGPKLTRRGRVRGLLLATGLALLVVNVMACYLIRKAYVAF